MSKRGIVQSISPRHVGRLLQEADLKPHRSRYWLFPPPRRRAFETKMSDISQLYLTAAELSEQGERVVCIDDPERYSSARTGAARFAGTTR